MEVKVTCYGETKVYPNAQEAIDFFREGMLWCDPNSSEFSRYATIVSRLMCGDIEVSDRYY